MEVNFLSKLLLIKYQEKKKKRMKEVRGWNKYPVARDIKKSAGQCPEQREPLLTCSELGGGPEDLRSLPA